MVITKCIYIFKDHSVDGMNWYKPAGVSYTLPEIERKSNFKISFTSAGTL